MLDNILKLLIIIDLHKISDTLKVLWEIIKVL